MNYWHRWIGSIQKKTAQLSLAEMGAYDRLLDHYYAQEKPLPGDGVYVICGAITRGDRVAVDHVLGEFFSLGPDGWEHAGEDAQRTNEWARLLDVGAGTWQKLRLEVFERDGYVCAYCDAKTERPDCDHILPLTRGGRSNLENLATACARCNRSKQHRTVNEWRAS